MEKSDLENYLEILQSFDTAMLVTQRGDEIRSRPMAIADSSPDGRIWFLTSIENGKLDELWSTAHRAWFADGKDDPSIIVLGIVPTYAEYWDNSGVDGIKALLKLGKSIVTQDPPEFDEDVHEKFDFPDHMIGAK